MAETRTKNTLVRWLWALGPSLLLMAGIYYLGSDTGSSESSSGILEWLFPQLTKFQLDIVNHWLRKAGHFTAYALLGLLNLRAASLGWPTKARVLLAAAFLAAVGWAAVDEYHQSFSTSRGASVLDVLLDACGVLTGVFLYYRWRLRTTRKG
jgi:VanZ family protein